MNTNPNMLGPTLVAAQLCRENKGLESCKGCLNYRVCGKIRIINRFRVGDDEEGEADER